MPTDLTIGQFSRLTHLSVKTLHHYHEVGVLSPARVDDGSGYRYYDPGQADTAHLVRRLRELDMPLPEVRDLLASPASERDAVLARHLERMQEELARTAAIVSSLQSLLGDRAPDPTPQEREVAATGALVRRETLDRADLGHEGVAAWVTQQLAGLDEAARRAGLEAAGPGSATFDTAFFEEDAGEVVCFLPLGERAADSADAVGGERVERMPGARYLVAVHHGAHRDLDRTYGVLGARAHATGRAASGPVLERYVVDPARVGSEDELRTEVCWPLRE